MKVYKDKQYLVFDFEDGRNVKYDFATKTAIGIKGKPVKDLNKQLHGLTLDELFDCCVDKNYANFLRFVKENGTYYATNIGTILSKVPKYSRYEQIFSAGFEDIINDKYSFIYSGFTINDIPKSLIKIAKDHKIKISVDLIKAWKQNVDAHYLAYQLEYMSLDDHDILKLITKRSWRHYDGEETFFNVLISKYNYNAKSLLLYCDHLKTFEAIDDMGYLIQELYDYTKMMSTISEKYDKYPRHFLTTHKIACRNYNRLKREFSEGLFKQRINKEYECSYKNYVFLYPKCTQDIKDEAVQQNNCVVSYIDRVIDGYCDILFLRKKDSPDKSLVTIEVVNNKIVQARRRFNDPVTYEDQEAIDYWNKKFCKENNKSKTNDKNDVEEEEKVA